MPQTFGRTCSGSSGVSARCMCLRRTSRGTQSSARLPTFAGLGMGRVLASFRPEHLELRTSDRDGGYVATPTATANQWSPSMKKHPGCSALAKMFGPGMKCGAFEFLMGWPAGWTDLGPLEMVKFQSWLRLHGMCLDRPWEGSEPGDD